VDAVLATVVGGLFAAGFYMLLRRSMMRMVVGLVLLGQAANLLVFAAAGGGAPTPPLLADGGGVPAEMADPLPQALVLTAVVINFGMLAFALVLAHRARETFGTDDLDAFAEAEQ
jgi:multicomponent Na+:H+ antiporter subunit C